MNDLHEKAKRADEWLVANGTHVISWTGSSWRIDRYAVRRFFNNAQMIKLVKGYGWKDEPEESPLTRITKMLDADGVYDRVAEEDE